MASRAVEGQGSPLTDHLQASYPWLRACSPDNPHRMFSFPRVLFLGIFWDPGLCLDDTKYRVSRVRILISGSRHAIRAVGGQGWAPTNPLQVSYAWLGTSLPDTPARSLSPQITPLNPGKMHPGDPLRQAISRITSGQISLCRLG